MKNTYKWGAVAFGISLISTLVYGQARTPFTRPAYVTTPGSVTTSAGGDQFVCSSTTAVCEVESNISAATMTSTVPAFDIGPTATPGANDRLACFSYGPTGSKTRMMCVDVEGDINANSLALGTTPSGIRAHFLTEGNTTGTYAPTTFDDKFAVFGRSATTGANSGGVFLTYHFGDNEGVVGALSPAIAWRPLSFPASEWKFRPSGLAAIANITSTGAFNSVAVSGNQAFTCTNVGCRLSLGNTSRFIFDDPGNGVARFEGWGVSTSGSIFTATGGVNATSGNPLNVSGATADGATAVATILRSQNTFSTAGSKITSFRNSASEVSFIDYLGNVSGNGFVATTASGSSLTGGGASGPLLLTSNATDAATSGTVPAIRLQASQNITDSDLLMSVEDSVGNRRLTLTEAGALNAAGSIVAGGQFTTASQYETTFGFFTATGATASVVSNVGSTTTSVNLRSTVTKTGDTTKLVDITNNTTNVAHFSKDGLLRVNSANAAKPTCNADNRGRIYFADGVTGGGATADVFEVCGKSAADVYSWKSIVTW